MRIFTLEICSVELINLSFLGSIVVVVVFVCFFFNQVKGKTGKTESIVYVRVEQIRFLCVQAGLVT